MGRPKKAAQIHAEQVLTNAINAIVDEPEVKLTPNEVLDGLQDYIEYGVKVRVDDLHWYVQKGKLSVSGSLFVPLKAVKEGADYLVAQERFVRAANRRDRNGNLAIGNIINKAGNDISHGE